MANIKLKAAIERNKDSINANTKQINKKVNFIKEDGTTVKAGETFLTNENGNMIPYVAPKTGGHITEITTGKVKDNIQEIFSAYESGGEAVLSIKTTASDFTGVAPTPLGYTNYKKNEPIRDKKIWQKVEIDGTRLFLISDESKDFMTADYDPATQVFSNVLPLDLSSELSSSSSNWRRLKIVGSKAYFVNSKRDKWMTADYNPVAKTFSNFRPFADISKITSASEFWEDLEISGTKAFFANNFNDKWMTADYNPVAETFDNFQPLDLSSKLSTNKYEWHQLVIYGTKAFFVNENKNMWMTADYDPSAGTFSKFQVLDMTTKLTTINDCYGFGLSGDTAIFTTGNTYNWMTANPISIVHKDGEHYDIPIVPYKKALTLHAVGDDILGDITKNKDYIEQDLGDGITSGGNPKLIIKH